jgi:hypothetical protein
MQQMPRLFAAVTRSQHAVRANKDAASTSSPVMRTRFAKRLILSRHH